MPIVEHSREGYSPRIPLGELALGDDADDTIDFYALPPGKPPIDPKNPTSFPDDSTVAGFWWIGTTEKKSEANMEIAYVTKKEIEVPVFTNSVEILPHTKLLKFKAKAAVVSLKGATVLSGNSREQPKKKVARKS